MKYILGLFLSLLVFNSCAPYESDAYKVLKGSAFTFKDVALTVNFTCDVISTKELSLLEKISFRHFVAPQFKPVKSLSKLNHRNEEFYVYTSNSKSAYTCFTNTENILDIDQESIFEEFKQHIKEASHE